MQIIRTQFKALPITSRFMLYGKQCEKVSLSLAHAQENPLVIGEINVHPDEEVFLLLDSDTIPTIVLMCSMDRQLGRWFEVSEYSNPIDGLASYVGMVEKYPAKQFKLLQVIK